MARSAQEGPNSPELPQRAWERCLGLLDAEAAASLGLLGLSEPRLDVTLLGAAGVEVLALVDFGDSVVALGHFVVFETDCSRKFTTPFVF